MKIKRFQAPLVLKGEGPEGTVTAVFSTFGVVDKDMDIVEPSAFTPGQQVPMTWAHNWSMPVGRGVILLEQDRALFSGHFFMATQAGQEAYKTVKAMADLQEWSWGFQVLDAAYETRDGVPIRVIKKAQVYEVSPVLVGAGEDTATLAIKTGSPGESKTVIPFKATEKAPEGEAWEAPTLADFTNKTWADLTDAEKRKFAQHYLWSANMPPEAFGDLKFPHHRPSDMAVVWKGVANCVARLNQADVPDADMPAMRAHLRGHYEQFERDVPDALKEADLTDHKGQPYSDHAEAVLAAAKVFVVRSRSLAELRTKEGRTLSEANRQKLAGLLEALNSIAKEIDDLLMATAKPEPEKVIPLDYLERKLRASGLLLAVRLH